MSGSGRFNKVENADGFPGVDLVTLSPTGPFVDTGLTLNKFDTRFAESNRFRVYLSVDTVRELAAELGLFGEEQASVLVQEAAWYNKGYSDAVKENLGGELRDIVDRLGNVSDIVAGLGRMALVTEPEEAERVEPELLDGDESDARVAGSKSD